MLRSVVKDKNSINKKKECEMLSPVWDGRVANRRQKGSKSYYSIGNQTVNQTVLVEGVSAPHNHYNSYFSIGY